MEIFLGFIGGYLLKNYFVCVGCYTDVCALDPISG